MPARADGTRPPPVVRSALVNAMGRLAGPQDMLYLTEALRDPEARVQANAIEGIMASSGAGGPDVIPHIRPFTASTNNRLKANAVLALWQQGEVSIGLVFSSDGALAQG